MNYSDLFNQLYACGTEENVDELLQSSSEFSNSDNWEALERNYSNYGVIENQQSNPIAALIEKITNSIDAILTKKCLEAGIDPKGEDAPRSMEKAVEKFFPSSKDWDMTTFRRDQSESLQIVADGPKLQSSLVIYDDGEGQHPHDFENTFLSLLRGNKNEIHFVQGKYNMGGSGAIVFCGKKGYQLIGSRKYDKTGDFGFTLVRVHPLTSEEKQTKKNTWYEYFLPQGKIPSFPIDKLNLDLYNRKFEIGTIIKLYSYDLPSGSRSVISRDLNQSINEYLFEPALPVLTVDKKDRYPDDKNLERPLYGLKRRLEQDDNKYIEEYFSETYTDEIFGEKGAAKVTCYLFKNRIDDKTAKETKDTVRNEFFKNNMSVLFSVNGQVHGHYTSEFIVRSLQMNLLKHHLLIHVDCTRMDIEFRNKLFMASRDRLKGGEETRALRDFLAQKLKANESLKDIVKRRKQIGSYDQTDTKDLLKSITKDLPLNDELRKLISDTLKLDTLTSDKPKKDKGTKKHETQIEPFNPERFPTRFKLKIPEKDGIKAVNIPRGMERRLQFDTDVENNYFDRVEEPGELKIGLAAFNEGGGGENPDPIPNEVDEVFNIVTSSPKNGTIRISLTPKATVRVGANIQMKVTLTGAGKDFEELFWAKITEPDRPTKKVRKPVKDQDISGIPELITVYKEKRDGHMSWEEAGILISDDFNYDTVMYPVAKGESELEKVLINMESNVLKSFVSKHKNPNEEQLIVAENKYKTSVYLHTLFLYAITKKRGFEISKKVEGQQEPELIDVGEYLRDVFDHYYSSFLLNYQMDAIMTGLGD